MPQRISDDVILLSAIASLKHVSYVSDVMF